MNNLPADDPLRQQPAPAQPLTPPVEAKKDAPLPGHDVVVTAGKVGVPSFVGEPVRAAVESADTAGLALQIVGSGIAREQVPAPGSQVQPGTEVVVRFSR